MPQRSKHKGHSAEINSLVVELIFGLLAVTSAVLLVYEVSTPLTDTQRYIINGFDLFTVVLFLTDFVLGLVRADKRWRYVGENWVNLLASIPFTEGAFRSFRLFRLFRLVKLIYVASEQHHGRFSILAQQLRSYANLVTFSIVAIMAGSIAFYSVEHAPNANIETYWDAVWWAFVSATTLGYGDITPVTTEGRVIAILLMVVGVGVVGTVAGLVGGYTLRRPYYTRSTRSGR